MEKLLTRYWDSDGVSPQIDGNVVRDDAIILGVTAFWINTGWLPAARAFCSAWNRISDDSPRHPMEFRKTSLGFSIKNGERTVEFTADGKDDGGAVKYRYEIHS